MRDHPIPPVTEPLQYRAIGIVRGVYCPEEGENFTRGKLINIDGEEIEAVVLAGGLGTRSRRVLGDTPKLLASVGGRPLIEHLMK